MPPKCQLLPPTNRGRGRGRGGRGNFNHNNNNNNRDWSNSGGTSWLSDQSPAERMIRRSLPTLNDETYRSNMPICHNHSNSSKRFQPYPIRHQQQPHHMSSNYPPAYPPPQAAFANPYPNNYLSSLSSPDDDYSPYGRDRRGGRGGRPMPHRGNRGGGGWQPRRGFHY